MVLSSLLCSLAAAAAMLAFAPTPALAQTPKTDSTKQVKPMSSGILGSIHLVPQDPQ